MNILTAILNIIENPIVKLKTFYQSRNRINNMGEALENYIKDLFASTLNITDEQSRILRFSDVFSYFGNQNNPPDMMIRGGDAIEVKKIEKKGASLSLNSSYPKAKFFSNDPKIKATCRNCENWQEKDMLYNIYKW